MQFVPGKFARPASRLALVAALSPLAACMADRQVVQIDAPQDYRARHPIVLMNSPTSADVFAPGPVLDRTTLLKVQEIGKEARSAGAAGRIEILMPQGSSNEAQQRAALPAIRRALGQGGAAGYVSVGVYPAMDPYTAAPMKISFKGLRAEVASQCGQWPSDLASGGTLESWKNQSHFNFGCSYQTMIAKQISDPRDLAEPRATENGDVEMRIRSIGKVRQGSDPATTWSVKNSSIGTVGGN